MKISLTSLLDFCLDFLFSRHSYLCNKKKITRWLEHMLLIFSWKKIFHSFAALTYEIFFPLKDKLHLFVPPCNIYILYIFHLIQRLGVPSWSSFAVSIWLVRLFTLLALLLRLRLPLLLLPPLLLPLCRKDEKLSSINQFEFPVAADLNDCGFIL